MEKLCPVCKKACSSDCPHYCPKCSKLYCDKCCPNCGKSDLTEPKDTYIIGKEPFTSIYEKVYCKRCKKDFVISLSET